MSSIPSGDFAQAIETHTDDNNNSAASSVPKEKKKKKKKSAHGGSNVGATGLSDVELSSPSELHLSPSELASQRIASPSRAAASGSVEFATIDVRSPPPPAAGAHARLQLDAGAATMAPFGNVSLTPSAHSSQLHPEAFERHIDFNDALSTARSHAHASGVPHDVEYPTNLVVTSRYTKFDFLPRNLFEQFCELSNLYFLFVGALQAIPTISTTQGVPTTYLPLLFILTVSALRSAIEDYNRHVTDEREGSKQYRVYDGASRQFVTKASADIVVGDVVQMIAGAEAEAAAARDGVTYSASFPADLLFLASAHEKGHCFVETASLDGESALKIKSSLPPTHELLWAGAGGPSDSSNFGEMVAQRVARLDLSVDIEGPNSKFDSCKGILHINNAAPAAASSSSSSSARSAAQAASVQLKAEHLLLRGTELRNTPSVYGLVVYTGAETKIRRNITSSSGGNGRRTKRSRIMHRVNQLLVFMLALQVLLCIFAAVLCFQWTDEQRWADWYLRLSEGPALAALRAFFSYFIILSQLVPISLLVSAEMVKAAQAFFIARDGSMYQPLTDQPTVVRNSQLHEDLGQVEYIFSDKTGTLTQNKMEFRVAFIGAQPFGSPDSEIARRVAARMEQLRAEQAAASPNVAGGNHSPVHALQREPPLPWTARVAKLTENTSVEQPAFNDDEKRRMLTALWGGQRREGAAADEVPPPPADPKLSAAIRTFLTHMAISNTITPELKAKKQPALPTASAARGGGGAASVPPLGSEYELAYSSPDELALCKFASSMGFQFCSRSKGGVQLSINKLGHGDGRSEVEIYQSLACLDFNSKRKRVTCIYLRDDRVHVMCKGADANILPLLSSHSLDALELRTTLEAQLNDMATKGLRTLLVAGSTLPAEWWFGDPDRGVEGMAALYAQTNLPDRGAEKGHHRGECMSDCRICAGLEQMERAANMELVGATAIEDRLAPLVPEAIADFLAAGVKVWMLTGDKRETARNIGLACNLIDPDMESASDLLGSMDPSDMNRVVEITGDWVAMTSKEEQLRQMFDILDCGGDIVDGFRTGYISREELRLFLIGLRVPGMDDERAFEAHWTLVQHGDGGSRGQHSAASSSPSQQDGRITFPQFSRFIKNLSPSHLRAVQTDVELGLRKARLIAGDGTEEEKRERLERLPIALVVEGEAFSVLFPSQPKRRGAAAAERAREAASSPLQSAWNRAAGATRHPHHPLASSSEHDDDDYASPEVLLLRATFFELASMAKSVICCRLTPAQKARIVEEFGRKGHVTLAIGDGGNDCGMIEQANIGVGITGLEGTAASRAADYAIGEFRFLHTLMFVHGQWCYRRIAKLTTYIFYKAAMVAFAMYGFCFYSAFSGQQFFVDAIYILYNVLFTAFPIVLLAIFDRGGLNRSTLENSPRAYLSVAHGYFFHDALFSRWMITALWNTLWIYLCVLTTVGAFDVSGPDGQNHGLWLTSTLVYTAVVMLATFRILFEAQTISVFIACSVIISFCWYWPVVLFVNTLQALVPNFYGVYSKLFANPSSWLVLILCVAVPLLFDAALWAWQRMHRPTYIDVLQERQKMSKSALMRMDQESLASHSSARVRTRAVPHLTQQQKDSALLAKIRRALAQAHQESTRPLGVGAPPSPEDDAGNAQRRAEALVYTMTRLQNLSGANLEATPQRGILSLYEVRDSLTSAQLTALKEKEAELAAQTTVLHQQQAQQAKLAEEARQHHEAEQRELAERRQAREHQQQQQQQRARRRSRGADSAHDPVLHLDDAEDDDELSDHEIHDVGIGQGRGRVHGQHQLDDDIELSISDNAMERDDDEERKE